MQRRHGHQRPYSMPVTCPSCHCARQSLQSHAASLRAALHTRLATLYCLVLCLAAHARAVGPGARAQGRREGARSCRAAGGVRGGRGSGAARRRGQAGRLPIVHQDGAERAGGQRGARAGGGYAQNVVRKACKASGSSENAASSRWGGRRGLPVCALARVQVGLG